MKNGHFGRDPLLKGSQGPPQRLIFTVQLLYCLNGPSRGSDRTDTQIAVQLVQQLGDMTHAPRAQSSGYTLDEREREREKGENTKG